VLRSDLGTFRHVLDAVRQGQATSIDRSGALLTVPADAHSAAFRVNAFGPALALEGAWLSYVPLYAQLSAKPISETG
jgi:hypothetical protein